MKTLAELTKSGTELRNENARRAALASGALRSLTETGDAKVADLELQRWEDIRAQFVGRLRLPWGTESAAVMKVAAAHRAYWRPAQVRLLVLSESHVWTRETELAAEVPLGVFGHPAAPKEFVRMVYCLGYGERDLLQGAVQGNFGSPQFWKLLAACIGESLVPRVVERTEPDFLKRLVAKLELLVTLKERGVWLMDACPVALYAASQPKPKMNVLAQALEIAWGAYTREAIRAAAPQAVMIVGKMVFDGIGGRIRALLGPSVPVEWMYQPQARRPAVERAAGIARLEGMAGRITNDGCN